MWPMQLGVLEHHVADAGHEHVRVPRNFRLDWRASAEARLQVECVGQGQITFLNRSPDFGRCRSLPANRIERQPIVATVKKGRPM